MTENLQNEMGTEIRDDEEIEVCGLTLYPIMMYDFEKYLACKDAFLIRQTTLPVRYMSMPLLSALFAMEMETMSSGKPTGGMLWRILTMLFLSLRIDTNAQSIVKNIHIKADREELDHIEVVQNQKTVKITPLMFSSQLRPKIAEQNGLELPDESQDPNLVRDAEEKRKSESDGHNDFNFSVEDMIFSVAHAEHIRPKEIRKTWSVKEFEGIRRAIDREKNFMKYGQAEMSGMVTFKKGNPYPSWEFDRKDDSLGMIALGKSGMAKMFGNENQQQNQ